MKTSLKLLPLVACMSLAFDAQAEQLAYSKQLIQSILPPGQKIDTSYLSRGLDMGPGIYELHLEVNGKPYQGRKIELREHNGKLEPVFKVSDLHGLPLKDEALLKIAELKPESELFPLSDYFEQVTAEVDVEMLQIKLSIPQIYYDEDNVWLDIAPEELWDTGINGGLLNYYVTANHYDGRNGNASKNTYINGSLIGQFNVGAWRLFTSGFLSYNREELDGQSNSSHDWDLWNTYLQRDINRVKGTLQLGEINTSGRIFDSIPMRGFRLATNEMMIPSADRSYSPVVEGIANSNAQILIRQNGHVVYTTNVAAGPFKLDKLPSFGNDGDLEVVIREADGTERIMLVPYSSIPEMLKAGQYRYDISVGKYFRRNIGMEYDKKLFSVATLSYGLPNDMTLYGGGLLSEKYLGAALGVGMSLGRWGAISFDATQSKAMRDHSNGIWEDLSGTAWRMRYEKTMLETGTTINLANYHYLTGNYRTFNEINENKTYHYLPVDNAALKSQWQVSVSQSVGQLGSLNGGMTYTTYRGSNQDTKTINLGYSTNIKGIGVYLNYGRNYEQRANQGWMASHTVMLNLNIPFSLFFSNSTYSSLNRVNAQYQGSLNKSINGDKTYQQRAMLNGYSEDNHLNWTVSQTLGDKQNRESSVRVGYDGTYFGSDLSYAYSRYANSYQAGLNGSLIIHGGGVTPARYAMDSVALIEVPGTPGVKLNSYLDTKTDMFGYAAFTNLTNYTRNEITIDPSTLPEGALLLDNTNKFVYPTNGAIVKVQYPIRFGMQAIFYLSDRGISLPLGSQVTLVDEKGEEDAHVRGLVGQNGRVFLTALPRSGRLKAIFGEEIKVFNYELPEPEETKVDGFQPITKIHLDISESI